MIKTNINKLSLLKLYKRDLVGKIILKRKSLIILKFLRKVYKIKKKYTNNIKKKNTNFFRILNIPRPQYNRRKTKYGKYFFLRQQFRIFYGFLRIRTLQLIIKKSFKKMNSINYFLYLMESRLDVILFRLNFVSSVRMARQLIVHGNIVINNRIIRNPNYNFKKKDILTFNNKNIYKYKLLLYYNIVSKL
jgi:ribosomal protein S4